MFIIKHYKAGSENFPLRIFFWQETADCYQIISIVHQLLSHVGGNQMNNLIKTHMVLQKKII